MLSLVEHEKSFITSGPGPFKKNISRIITDNTFYNRHVPKCAFVAFIERVFVSWGLTSTKNIKPNVKEKRNQGSNQPFSKLPNALTKGAT